MAEREFSTAQRRRLEEKGETGYGESYPLTDCDAVRRAIQSYGRAPAEHRAELRRAIARRRRELGCTEPLPSTWYAGEHGGSHVVLRSGPAKRPEADRQPSYRVKLPKRKARA